MRSSDEYFEELKEVYSIKVNTYTIFQQDHICMPSKIKSEKFTDKLFDLKYKKIMVVK